MKKPVEDNGWELLPSGRPKAYLRRQGKRKSVAEKRHGGVEYWFASASPKFDHGRGWMAQPSHGVGAPGGSNLAVDD